MQLKYKWEQIIVLPILADEIIVYHVTKLEQILHSSIVLSVKECLDENGGNICTTLSGGLDSSFCLAKIREIIGPDGVIHTFTTASNESHPDIQFARIVSELFGTVHHELILSAEKIETAKKELHACWPDELQTRGDIAVFATYKNISQQGLRCVIAHDGIDELLGGYWEHRRYKEKTEMIGAFHSLWSDLQSDHLIPLTEKAELFNVEVVFPYLQEEVVKYITKIPLNERTSFAESKIPLRKIAKKYLPGEVIERKKLGFCSALDY